jgi:hypothetical protein
MQPTNTQHVDLVISLADALNAHDLDRARSFLADDMEFVGVFGPPLKGAEAYLSAMGSLRANQRILKIFADETDVGCFYELTLPSAPNNAIFGCGWFKITDGRVHFIRVVFDPTSLSKRM